jgi:hypothetical protein
VDHSRQQRIGFGHSTVQKHQGGHEITELKGEKK